MRLASSKRTASKFVFFLKSIVMEALPFSDVELMSFTPLSVLNTPSSLEVTSCSITFADTSFQLKETLRLGLVLDGDNCTLNTGIKEAPIMDRQRKIMIMEKEDVFDVILVYSFKKTIPLKCIIIVRIQYMCHFP